MKVLGWVYGPGDTIKRGDRLGELSVDGEVRPIIFTDDEGVIRFHYVQEGEEVGPGCQLLEYSWLDSPTEAPVPNAWRARPSPVVERDHLRRIRRVRREGHARIFLNYRRTDSEAYTGRLYEALLREFGEQVVFMDQFSIRPGDSFAWAVQQSVAHCTVLVALIGPAWTTVTDDHGERRLFIETDFVRRELTAALDRRVAVIPTILPGAIMPRADQLPSELWALEELQALELSGRHWSVDVERLVSVLREELKSGEGHER